MILYVYSKNLTNETEGHMTKKDFANFITYERIKLGLTQDELAKMLDVERSSISKWETGKQKPNVNTAKKLADILKIDIAKIYIKLRSE